MKKTIFVLIAMFISSMAFSQDGELPSKVDNALNAKYPEAKNKTWNLEGNNYKIEFEELSETYTVIYTDNGIWVETAKIISDSDLSEKALEAINKKYPGTDIFYSELVENAKGEIFFRVNTYTNDADYIINVTEEGSILKVEKKESSFDLNEG